MLTESRQEKLCITALFKVNNRDIKTKWHSYLWSWWTSMMQIFCKNSYSSHRRCSGKKTVLRNFAKFPRKHLCQRLFFNKVAGLRPATLLKKSLWHRCFPVNIAKFSKNTFFKNNSGGCFSIRLWWWLLVDMERALLIKQKFCLTYLLKTIWQYQQYKLWLEWKNVFVL